METIKEYVTTALQNLAYSLTLATQKVSKEKVRRDCALISWDHDVTETSSLMPERHGSRHPGLLLCLYGLQPPYRERSIILRDLM